MKLFALPSLLFCLAALPRPASAVVTLGPSTQIFGLTGIGLNASGQGQSKVSWGSCAYDGTDTNCTLSGPFTGLGSGGTYSFVLSYPGQGAFPLIAVVADPSTNQFTFQAVSAYSLVITLSENNGPSPSFYSFANFRFQYSTATCTAISNCSVGQVGLVANATISGPITGSFDPTPTITPSGVLSAANYGSFSAIAPATWIEIYGVNLATTRGQVWAGTDFNGTQAPAALGGTTVTVAGIPAYVDYVSPGQVNVQVPSGVPSGQQPLLITTAGGTSVPYTVTVNALEPGLLAPHSFSINGNQNVVALFAGTLTYVLPGAIAGVATNRAKPGDNITLYGIGFGPVTPNIPAGQVVQQNNALMSNLQISFAGVVATVTYAGLAPGYVGLYQFNVVVPTVAASDTVPLTFTLAGAAGPQNLVIAIKN